MIKAYGALTIPTTFTKLLLIGCSTPIGIQKTNFSCLTVNQNVKREKCIKNIQIP